MIITPKVLNGSVTVPPSKSHAHRAIICAALSDNDTIIHNVAMSQDMEATIDALRQLGADITVDSSTLHIKKYPRNKKLDEHITIDCNESGSTLRFMIPIALYLANKVTFTGSGRLPKRSLDVYFEMFDEIGVEYSHGEDYLPLTITGPLPYEEDYDIRGDVSSQFISGLLLALGINSLKSDVHLTTPLQSQPYVDITIRVMKEYSVSVLNYPDVITCDYENDGYYMESVGYTSKGVDTISGDWSQAGFHILAGLAGNLAIKGLDILSPQGDKEIFNIIEEMGGDISIINGDIVCKKSKLKAIEVDVSDIPDMAVVIAGAMAVAEGKSLITGAKRLRLKESDRIESVISTINALGGQAWAEDDNIVIIGKERLTGGSVTCHNDHRIAMLAGALSVYCDNEVMVDEPQCVAKSYPDYWQDFTSLGGKIDEQHIR